MILSREGASCKESWIFTRSREDAKKNLFLPAWSDGNGAVFAVFFYFSSRLKIDRGPSNESTGCGRVVNRAFA